MPANLPAEAKHKWAEVSATNNPRKKLQLLQEFFSLVPKHKGTAKLCVQVKKQMASLRKTLEEKKRRKVGKSGPKFFIEKEEAPQIVILGLTNCGKSSLLLAVTNAKVKVSPTPYTTRDPKPGILTYQDLQFQIVEAPAIMAGSANGRAWGLQTLALARNADGLILMVDSSHNPVGQLSLILEEMEKARILTAKPKGHVEIEKKHIGAGLQTVLVGTLIDSTIQDVKELLRSYRIMDAVVKIYGEITLDDIEDTIFENTIYKPTIVVANKSDLKTMNAPLKLPETHLGFKLPVIAVSCKTGRGLRKLCETLVNRLDIIRVYTKEPKEKDVSKRPFILQKGATVYDLAKKIHSDFSEKFAFAKIWAKRLVFSPQKVGSAFILEDGDIVEIHIK